MGYKVISTIEQYDAMLASINTASLPEFHPMRFERLTPEQLAIANDWFIENGSEVVLEFASPEFALHVLGAQEVSSLQGYDFHLGKGKTTKYYQCSRNQHNRKFRDNPGLRADLRAGLIAVGPSAHIGPFGEVLSIQHRPKLALQNWVETGVWMPFSVKVTVGLPICLSGTLDRNIVRKDKDQEYMDSEQFPSELIREYFPDTLDISKIRDACTGFLVTVRNNVFARINGNDYHPGKKQQPTSRQALDIEEAFGNGMIQRLILRLMQSATDEAGKPRRWSSYLSIGAVASAICLSQVRNCAETEEIVDNWNDDEVTTIVDTLVEVHESSMDAFSLLVNGLSSYKKQKKVFVGAPTDDRLVFFGLVPSMMDCINGVTGSSYFPSESTIRKLSKDSKAKPEYPRFGGLDSPKSDDKS